MRPVSSHRSGRELTLRTTPSASVDLQVAREQLGERDALRFLAREFAPKKIKATFLAWIEQASDEDARIIARRLSRYKRATIRVA